MHVLKIIFLNITEIDILINFIRTIIDILINSLDLLWEAVRVKKGYLLKLGGNSNVTTSVPG